MQSPLYTFAQSPKHIGLYQKFGFWPRFLTALMSKSVGQTGQVWQWSRFSEVPEGEQGECLSACRELTDAVYEGLDLQREIRAVNAQRLGDTVLLWNEARLVGLAVCHYGAGSEAGSDTCYVKFGAAQPGPAVGQVFDQLLDACEGLAVAQNTSRLLAGVNMGRHEAYRRMIARGFRTDRQGIVMQKPNEAGYNQPDVYALDDWR